MPRRLLPAALIAAALLPAALLPAPSVTAAEADDTVVVRAWFDDPSRIAEVSHLLGHAQIDRDKGLLRTEADAALREALRAAGFELEIDVEATERVRELQLSISGQRAIPGYACYRTVEETEAGIGALAAAYPQLLSIQEIGETWQSSQGNPGYELKVVVATSTVHAGPKPKLFMLSSIHAREYTPAELATRFIEDLVLGYGHDAEATWLLDHHEVHALLQGNPDGRKRAEAGLSWRKNRNTTHCGTGSAPGVDLNRNYPFEWGQHNGSSGTPCAETFRGPAPGSEPETQAVVDYVRSQFEDRRGPLLTDPAPDDTQGMFLDIHSYSRLVLWPWGFTSTPAPNGPALARLGRRLAWFNDYTAEQAIGLYATDGTTDDFAYGELGLPAYTFELGTAFFQDCASFEHTVFPHNSAALRYAARSIGAPYRWPAGPDVFDLAVEPDLTLAGEPATLRASADDSRQQTRVTSASGPVPPVQNVASAVATIATPPWQPGAVALPMQAQDGAFDSPVETLQLAIDTNGLATGRHLVFVQARDAAGNDGPPNAAFVDVVDAADAVHLEGRIRQAETRLPLAATIRVGRYRSSSDPVDGRYQRLLPPGSFDLAVEAPGHEPAMLRGLPGVPGSLVRQDITLFQLCSVLDDPVEVGLPSSFTAQAPWTLRAGLGRDGGAAWLPSPGANYANNLNITLTSDTLALAGFDAARLQFDSLCDTEAGWDFGVVEVSPSGSAPWTEVFRCDGDASWRTIDLPLPMLADAANARIRFRFTSDGSVTRPGWRVDAIRLSAGGPACRATQPTDPVRIDGFVATPATIAPGASSRLDWQTAHADECELGDDAGGAPIALAPGELDAGDREVSPAGTTAYTLTCAGHDGPVQAQLTVEVAAAATILRFAAEPPSIVVGGTAMLDWSTSDADACTVQDDAGGAPQAIEPDALAAGTLAVAPSGDTGYTLHCTGPGGDATATTAVAVRSPAVFVDGFDGIGLAPAASR
jgi:carboxypeptidase T